jgi:hypothetical protein
VLDSHASSTVAPVRMCPTNAAAGIHSPLYSPGTLAPVVMRDCGRFGTVSKTVVRASVPRVRIPPPPLLWLGRAKFAAAARSSTKGETSRDRYSGVNERQRTSTTASAAGISFPHLFPGRPREHEAGGRATGLEIPFAMQKVEGSNPFSRFEKDVHSQVFSSG